MVRVVLLSPARVRVLVRWPTHGKGLALGLRVRQGKRSNKSTSRRGASPPLRRRRGRSAEHSRKAKRLRSPGPSTIEAVRVQGARERGRDECGRGRNGREEREGAQETVRQTEQPTMRYMITSTTQGATRHKPTSPLQAPPPPPPPRMLHTSATEPPLLTGHPEPSQDTGHENSKVIRTSGARLDSAAH